MREGQIPGLTLRFGEYIKMGDVIDTVDRVLVGRVRGQTYSMARLKQWTTKIWGHILTNLPSVQSLARDWFTLLFARDDYTTWILSKLWHIEHTSVLLKRWSPLFDPEREKLGAVPLWVIILGLPLHFWSEDIFRRIGNALSTYLEHDNSYLSSGNMSLAEILVHLDTREGLEEHITLHWKHYSHTQILDYEGVPFRCRRCHKVGHLYKECPLNKKSSAIGH